MAAPGSGQLSALRHGYRNTHSRRCPCSDVAATYAAIATGRREAPMAPGFESYDALKRSKEADQYWTKVNSKPATQAAE